MIDYWCNAFTPDRAPLWRRGHRTPTASPSSLGARDADDFCPTSTRDGRCAWTGLGIDHASPAGDARWRPTMLPSTSSHHYAAAADRRLHQRRGRRPPRAVRTGCGAIRPDRTVTVTSKRPNEPRSSRRTVSGSIAHTHSWDRPLRPCRGLCAVLHALVRTITPCRSWPRPAPVRRPPRRTRLGHPGGDRRRRPRPIPTSTFVLSHHRDRRGWTETIRAARRSRRTSSSAPRPTRRRRWPPALVDFLRTDGTRLRTVGHGVPAQRPRSTSLGQLDALDVDGRTKEASRPSRPRTHDGSSPASLPESEAADDRVPCAGSDRPTPCSPSRTGPGERPTISTLGPLRVGVEYRKVDPAALEEAYGDNASRHAPRSWRTSPEGGFTDEGVSIHVIDASRRPRVRALRRVRRRAALPLCRQGGRPRTHSCTTTTVAHSAR